MDFLYLKNTDEVKDSMVRLLSVSLLLMCSCLTCLTHAWSADDVPAFRTARTPQTTGSTDNFNHFSQQNQNSFRPGMQGQPAGTRAVASTPRSVSEVKQRQAAPVRQVKSVSNPITPLDRDKQPGRSENQTQRSQATPSIWGTLGALGVVIALILVGAKLFKKHSPMASASLPREVMEVLGKQPLDAQQSIHFIRCGSRILILGSSPAGLQMLSEVHDPVEVDLISGMCRERNQAARANSTFLNLFQTSQSRTEPGRPRSAENRFPGSESTKQAASNSETDSGEFSDYDSAISRLQQKLMHPSRQSLNEATESDHG